MILPDGREIRVGWAPHELLWLEAANHLSGKEREAALRDIASLAGRGLQATISKARNLRKQEREDARTALSIFLGRPFDHPRKIMVRTPTMAVPKRYAVAE